MWTGPVRRAAGQSPAARDGQISPSVHKQGFDADGENDGWDIANIQSSTGIEAYVAQTLSGCSWEGIDRTFIGVFPSLATAKQALGQLGYLDGG